MYKTQNPHIQPPLGSFSIEQSFNHDFPNFNTPAQTLVESKIC